MAYENEFVDVTNHTEAELRDEIDRIRGEIKRRDKENKILSLVNRKTMRLKNWYDETLKTMSLYVNKMLSAIPSQVFLFDADLKVIVCSDASSLMTGRNAADMPGTHLLETLADSVDRESVLKLYRQVLRAMSTGEDFSCGTSAVFSGEMTYFKKTINPIKGENGEVIGVLLTYIDVTDLREMTLRAEEAGRLKSRFLANMSHEIRTPMNTLLGMSELASREELTPKLAEYISSIRREGASLMAIVNDILDFSKIESGKMEINESDYSLSSLIQDAVNNVRVRLADQPIRFATDIAPDLPAHLYGDHVKVRQVILNLLSNAVKYTREGAVVLDLSCEREGDRVKLRISVKDTGIGIRQEDIPKLFEFYTQFDRDINAHIEGTGLGLPITYGICEAMGGSIEVMSEHGKGSEFVATLWQKAISEEPFAKVENRADKRALLYIACDVYARSIAKAFDSLGAPYVVAANADEFQLLLQKKGGQFTHIFIEAGFSDALANSVRAYSDAEVIVIADAKDIDVQSTFYPVSMPIHSLTIANLLNNKLESFDMFNHSTQELEKFVTVNTNILIVDDIQTNLRVAEGLMEPYGMNIDLCTNGLTAIEMAKKKDYDIIFMDHMMPEMDGIEAAKRIRALGGKHQNTVIVALTANAVSGYREVFLENGFNDFLAKPIEMKKLHALLATWVPLEKQVGVRQEEGSDEKRVINLAIDGVNVNRGLVLSGGNVDLYLDTLTLFARDMRDKTASIIDAIKREDYESYILDVHSIKGTAASIGATEVSRAAKTLEVAGRKRNREVIIGNTYRLIDMLSALIADIEFHVAAYRAGQGEAAHQGKDDLLSSLARLKTAIDELDSTAFYELISEIRKTQWGGWLDEQFRAIESDILMFELDDAIAKINTAMREIEAGRVLDDESPSE